MQPFPNESTIESSDCHPQLNQENSIATNDNKEIKDDTYQTPLNSRNEYYSQESQSLFSENSQNTMTQSQETSSQQKEQSQQHINEELSNQTYVFDAISNSERSTSVFPGINDEANKLGSNPDKCSVDSQKQEISHKESADPTNDSKFSNVAVVSETESIENMQKNLLEINPNMKMCVVKRTFTAKEEEARYKTIVDRSIKALALCLKRFPEHYKSQYKIAFVATYFETHRVCQLFVRIYDMFII